MVCVDGPQGVDHHILLYKLKIFSERPVMTLQFLWKLLALAKYSDLMHTFVRSVRMTFLPLQIYKSDESVRDL
jgi:hypothetical protein